MTDVSSQNPPTVPPPLDSDVDTSEATRPARLTRKQADATTAAEPAELKSKSRRRRGIQIDVGEDEPPTWKQNLLRTIVSALGVGFGASMIVHVATIVVLAFCFVDFEKLLPEFVINGGADKEGIAVELDSELPIELAQKQGGPAEQQPTLLNASEFVTRSKDVNSEIPADLENRINQLAETDGGAGKSKGDGSNDSDGTAPKGAARVGKNAVTKGKFTVWSEPSNPAVGQSYHIWIRVQLPPTVKRFRVDDLTGTVSGDLDGHRQAIPHDPRWGPPKVRYRGKDISLRKKGYVPIRKVKGQKYAIIYIWVPGSQVPKTTDTVQIRSKMLNEAQKLKIVF